MTQTKHFCDFCGDLITSGRTHLLVKCGDYRHRTGTADLDACPDCWATKLEPIISPIRPATAEHVGGAPERPKRRSPILVARNGA